jgi:hypothetical protein
MAHQVVEDFQYLAQVEVVVTIQVVLVVIFQVNFLAAVEETQAGVAVIPEAVMEALMDHQILAQTIRSGYHKSRNSTGNSNTM